MIYYKNLYYKLEYKISLQYTADRKFCQLQMCQIENNPHGNSENYIFWLCNKYSKYILAFDYRLMRKWNVYDLTYIHKLNKIAMRK